MGNDKFFQFQIEPNLLTGDPINVLSLFDGMSCGQIALERAAIEVKNYFASEIDEYAMKVALANYPNTKQIGSVTEVRGSDLPKIDLLFGGSPCQSFSNAGKGEGFDGSSKLFWEFVRVLKEVKPTYFLLENVVMKKKWINIITNALGVRPIKINSRTLSAQFRPRLYWTNIPNVEQPKQIECKLADILENLEFDREPYEERYNSNKAINYKTEKFHTLTAQPGGITRGKGICDDIGWWRMLTPIECERLQTVPDNYTNHVSDAQRYKMIGNGWTVDVIVHIFSFLNIRNDEKAYIDGHHRHRAELQIELGRVKQRNNEKIIEMERSYNELISSPGFNEFTEEQRIEISKYFTDKIQSFKDENNSL